MSGLQGEITPPGDKSISHRAIMLSSIARGKSRISNLLQGFDCQATIDAFSKMGISIHTSNDKTATIEGKGLRGLKKPDSGLYLANSGTTMRLLMGILAGQDFEAMLTGDESLSKRPMKRVTYPLRLMGADIAGKDDANLAPITINGTVLKPIDYKSPVASAQVKSSIIFAGLYADGITTIAEPFKSRDHTERMLRLFGANLKEEDLSVSVEGLGSSELKPQSISVPGDISSAAFFIVLGILAEDAQIKINHCGVNSTRRGILDALGRMGAKIELAERIESFEPIADIIVKRSPLRATKITKDEIPLLIDEVPLIALCATQAEGETIIEGIGELRVKETDRVSSVVTNLKAFGADIEAEGDSLIIKGPRKLKGAKVESFGDHRTAMMSVIAGAIAEGKTTVDDTGCIATSFPEFEHILASITNTGDSL
ncbi:MAG: 3-phosphoshikimate 1-carboxyvinyltransferase [Candidatus Omnitrophica bacterium]|nr:3-phosphoshikimate 1-carboxyvinyltransferase [Candidatus Omnitrophota bacterium]